MQFLFFAFEQLLFYWCFRAIIMALRLFIKAIVYSPQIITAYFICRFFLSKADTALLWLTAIMLIAGLIHILILVLKQMIVALRDNGNFLWIPLLVIGVGYTCIFPVWMVFEPVKYLMHYISNEKALLLTWLFSVGFGVYLYMRYDFIDLRSN